MESREALCDLQGMYGEDTGLQVSEDVCIYRNHFPHYSVYTTNHRLV